MKKMLMMLVMVVTILVGGNSISEASDGYDQYLWGNHDYQLVQGSKGIGYYLDLTSITVTADNEIVAIVLQHNTDNSISSRTIDWQFDYSAKTVCYWNDRMGQWVDIPMNGGSEAVTKTVKPAFTLAFYKAFHKPFTLDGDD